MKTKITVITDNIPNGGLSGEWGLCLLVEYKDKKILVDAGASDLFLTNMKELGFETDDVDFATLSQKLCLSCCLIYRRIYATSDSNIRISRVHYCICFYFCNIIPDNLKWHLVLHKTVTLSIR